MDICRLSADVLFFDNIFNNYRSPEKTTVRYTEY